MVKKVEANKSWLCLPVKWQKLVNSWQIQNWQAQSALDFGGAGKVHLSEQCFAMIGRADIKGSEKEFELLSTYVLVRFWIEDKILFFGLRENSAKKFSDAQLFDSAP